MNEQRVQVFSLKLPSGGTPVAQRRYLVRWRVDGRDRMRSRKVRAEAERLRSRLLLAVAAGEEFDPQSGEPVSWSAMGSGSANTLTWWSWSREWLELKWGRWSGNSRRSGVESLVAFTPHLVRDRTVPGPELGQWLREVGYRPGLEVDRDDAVWRWLDRCSVPMVEITPSIVEQVLTLGTTKRDGATMAASVIRRRRGVLKAVFTAAVRRGVIDASPFDAVEWDPPRSSIVVDVSLVPSPTEIKRMVDHVASIPTAGAKYATLFGCVGMGGLRPSEAIGLRVSDLDLPAEGWGLARLRAVTTAPGTRYTTDGNVHEQKGLKHRAASEVREVPLPPVLVEWIRDHLTRFPAVDGRVFSTTTARPMSTGNYTDVWTRSRAELWPKGHHLQAATVYDLRHGAATMMLRAGVMPAEVARRLGHSVDVLNRVYAGVIHGEREQSNALIDSVLEVA